MAKTVRDCVRWQKLCEAVSGGKNCARLCQVTKTVCSCAQCQKLCVAVFSAKNCVAVYSAKNCVWLCTVPKTLWLCTVLKTVCGCVQCQKGLGVWRREIQVHPLLPVTRPPNKIRLVPGLVEAITILSLYMLSHFAPTSIQQR